jgi:hypothetical protein
MYRLWDDTSLNPLAVGSRISCARDIYNSKRFWGWQLVFAWKCLEHIASVAGGCVALASGVPEPGLVIGGVSGALALSSLIVERLGRESPGRTKELGSVRAALLEKFSDDIIFGLLPRADLNAADEALERSLPKIVIDRVRLAEVAVDEKGFPKSAAALIVGELVKVEPIFSSTGRGEDDQGICRKFALEVIETAMSAALSDREYVAELAPFLSPAIAQGVGRVQAEIVRQADLSRRRHEELLALIQSIDGNTPEPALVEAGMKFGEIRPGASKAEILAHLERFATEYHNLRKQLAILTANDNRLQGARQAAEAALAHGDIDLARRCLAEAIAISGERAAERRVQWETIAREEADALASLARADILAWNWQAADLHWTRARELVAQIDLQAADELAWEAAEALDGVGERFGTELFQAAVTWWRRLARPPSTRYTRIRAASAYYRLGSTLVVMGRHCDGKTGAGLLAEAEEALGRSLQYVNKGHQPTEWAYIQLFLGDVFRSQAKRCELEIQRTLLAKAIDMYVSSQTIFTHIAMPDKWAMVQIRLGEVLGMLGTNTEGESGAALLNDAVEACRAAVRVLTKDSFPVEWKIGQFRLGEALVRQAEHFIGEDGKEQIREAIVAQDAALRDYSIASDPMNYVSLGKSYYQLAVRTSDSAEAVEFLKRAIQYFRCTIVDYNRKSMAAAWAEMQYNLSLALFDLAKHSSGGEIPSLVGQARVALSASLRVWTESYFPLQYQKAKNTQIALEEFRTTISKPRRIRTSKVRV